MKIDVHWHFYPEAYMQEIRREGNAWGAVISREDGREYMGTGTSRHPLLPEMYQPEAQLREMDRRGLDLVAISAPPPLFMNHIEGTKALDLHQMVNDRLAELMQTHPGRFAGLAAVPLQSPELAIRELERAMLQKGLSGVEIATNIAGRNLDEPEFLPFFQRAAELGAFVFVHPNAVLGQDRLRRYYLGNLIGNPTDTAVAIASLVFGGVYDAAPGLNCCFAHGGGSFAMLLGRWDHGYHARPESRLNIARPPSHYLPRIYVDSLTHDADARGLALQKVGADHMLMGSDLPFDMGDPEPVASIEQQPGLSRADRDLILGGTAARLLHLAS